MAIAAAGELAEVGVGEAMEEGGSLLGGEAIPMTEAHTWGSAADAESVAARPSGQAESNIKQQMNRPGLGNKETWGGIAQSAITAAGGIASSAIGASAQRYSADQQRNALMYNSNTNLQIANVKANNNLALQQNQYAFTKSMFNQAESELAKAGLPSYVLFTGGTMPSVQRQLAGTTSTVKVPMGASQQWWRTASQF